MDFLQLGKFVDLLPLKKHQKTALGARAVFGVYEKAQVPQFRRRRKKANDAPSSPNRAEEGSGTKLTLSKTILLEPGSERLLVGFQNAPNSLISSLAKPTRSPEKKFTPLMLAENATLPGVTEGANVTPKV
jgi:hypothetical protein